jgi:GH35 family endo-1,4-beta-xylanase
LSDRLTWLSEQATRADGLPVRVLPLDDQLRRKPAWTAVVNALQPAAPARSAHAPRAAKPPHR